MYLYLIWRAHAHHKETEAHIHDGSSKMLHDVLKSKTLPWAKLGPSRWLHSSATSPTSSLMTYTYATWSVRKKLAHVLKLLHCWNGAGDRRWLDWLRLDGFSPLAVCVRCDCASVGHLQRARNFVSESCAKMASGKKRVCGLEVSKSNANVVLRLHASPQEGRIPSKVLT